MLLEGTVFVNRISFQFQRFTLVRSIEFIFNRLFMVLTVLKFTEITSEREKIDVVSPFLRMRCFCLT